MDDIASSPAKKPRLTDDEIAEIRRRRPGARASLACEGMFLTAEEEALFDQMEEERLTPDQSAVRIAEFCRERRLARARGTARGTD